MAKTLPYKRSGLNLRLVRSGSLLDTAQAIEDIGFKTLAVKVDFE